MIAKCVRDTPMSKSARTMFCREFCNRLEAMGDQIDRNQFGAISTGDITYDHRTGYLEEEFTQNGDYKV